MLLSQHCFDRAFNSIVDHRTGTELLGWVKFDIDFQFYSRSSFAFPPRPIKPGEVSFNSIVDHLGTARGQKQLVR